jgi:hypothetical protein
MDLFKVIKISLVGGWSTARPLLERQKRIQTCEQKVKILPLVGGGKSNQQNTIRESSIFLFKK